MGTLPDGLNLRPVGWLGKEVTTTGAVPDAVIDSLLRASIEQATFTDGTAGWHDCELCPGPEAWYSGGKVGPVIEWRGQELRLYGHGHHLIRDGAEVFMAPALILHYILDHSYQPPKEFLDAVTHGVFLVAEDLIWSEPTSAVETSTTEVSL